MHTHPAYDCQVSVVTEYLAAQSSPATAQFVYAYTVTLRNRGQMAVQLISRHWIIRDALQQVREVKGLGVVGEQPLLQPGAEFSYTSHVVFPTPSGEMYGHYHLATENADWFELDIPLFSLHQAAGLH